LADFSGYLAADELYDGPFCVWSAVDPRQQRRLLYEVLVPVSQIGRRTASGPAGEIGRAGSIVNGCMTWEFAARVPLTRCD
jgi:hypothetical protein